MHNAPLGLTTPVLPQPFTTIETLIFPAAGWKGLLRVIACEDKSEQRYIVYTYLIISPLLSHNV